MNKRENSTVREIIELILVYALLLQMVLLFFVRRRIYVSIGIWIGVVLAIYMAVSIQKALTASMGVNADSAQKHILKHSVFRYLIVAVIFGVVVAARLGDPFACFAGLMGLKAAAFLQPVYHRFKNKFDNKEVE